MRSNFNDNHIKIREQKMKTETQIAQENIMWIKSGDLMGRPNEVNKAKCQEHKATLKRFLRFLKDGDKQNCSHCMKPNWLSSRGEVYLKITDIQQAIKLYNNRRI